MPDITQAAAGRTCQVRMPGICRSRPDDCVLAHAHFPGLRGTAGKAFDFLGAWACSGCHDEYDRRTRHVDSASAQLWFYEGVLRTQNILLEEGAVLITADYRSTTSQLRVKKKKSKGNTASPSKCLPRVT